MQSRSPAVSVLVPQPPVEHATGGSSVAFDDPVPADSGIFRGLLPDSFHTHSIERQVQRRLLAQPNLRFSSLVVRRLPNGVCLEGVLEATDGADINSLAQQVNGVQNVINRLVVQGTDLKPGRLE